MLIIYGSNSDYSDCNTTQNFEIKKVEVEQKVQQSTSEHYLVGTNEYGCVKY